MARSPLFRGEDVKVSSGGAREAHLTYCTNIHPGERWEEVRRNIEQHVVRVKQLVSPDQPFGVGLRLSAQAAEALDEPAELDRFLELLHRNDLYVFTVNGFPYGSFHGTRVKERVYRPDWLEEPRLAYTNRLARLLARMLPRASVSEGTVSTVPGAFRARASSKEEMRCIAENLVRHAAVLHRIEREQGVHIGLAVEPEPRCCLETIAETIAFFEEQVLSVTSRGLFSSLSGLADKECESALRRHLGVCFDTCHAAVEFEHPIEAVRALARAGIRIMKVQLSAGLRVHEPSNASVRGVLAPFAEEVYLHQVVGRRSDAEGALVRWDDLPDALRDASSNLDVGGEWRIHFHVPLFRAALGAFESTQDFVAQVLELQAREPFCAHFEVETYTWDVLPPEFRGEPVVSAITRELEWARARFSS